MISEDNYALVKKAIKVHGNLKGRTYLILYKTSAKHKAKVMEASILEENFWHLVGCKINDSLALSPKQKHQLYQDCLADKDISASLVYTRQAQDVAKKANVVISMFDFVDNAKTIRLCHTDGTPEAAMFRVGAGSNNGVIGYSYEDKGMIPKTAQQKSIFKIKVDANDKIFLVISKPYGNGEYDRLDYVISPKIFPDILKEFPKGILYKKSILKIVSDNDIAPSSANKSSKMEAFARLEISRKNTTQSIDFEKEREDAMNEKYGV